MKIFGLILFISLLSNQPPVEPEKIIGKWKVIKVEYLDREPVRKPDGTQLIFEFKPNGVCVNHFHQSSVAYEVKNNQLDMAGYSGTIEKLTDQELVFRENKHFFLRRFHCLKID